MIKLSLDTVMLLVVIVAVLVGVKIYVLPAVTDALSERLTVAAVAK